MSTKKKSLEPWKRLDGKVVMVTGASSGIGRDLCLDLAKAGCNVIAAARRIDRLKSLCEDINHSTCVEAASGARAVALELDVSASGKEIEVAVEKAWDAFGWIDTLINNAGFRGNVNSPLDISDEEWESNVRTNLTGSWLVSKHVCKRISSAGRKGSIINVSSIAGLDRGQLPGSIAYSASKAALNTMTKIMAMELGVHNIRVNAIAPGLFKSEITEALMEKEWLSNVAWKIIPLRKLGAIDPALTSLVRYLVHDLSGYVSGNVFIADVGYTLPGTVNSPLDIPDEEWESNVRTNLTGSWLVSKHVSKRISSAGRKGSIINVSSIAGLDRGQLPGSIAYSASKAALNTMTKIMAMELGVHNIRVNAIAPGLFKSEITEALMEKDWLSNVALKIIPLRKLGGIDPALTSLVRYLVHDLSGYVSGNVFIADVGYTLPRVPIFSSL